MLLHPSGGAVCRAGVWLVESVAEQLAEHAEWAKAGIERGYRQRYYRANRERWKGYNNRKREKGGTQS